MTIGWGIVGCGAIADTRIAPAIQASDNARLVALCSRSLEKAAQFADRHGADRGYDDLADLIDDPEVQAVYVATPNACHAEQTIALLAGGKHVLCDKPLGVDADEVERMVLSAESAGRNLGVACQMRYLPALGQIRDLIETGQLGQLLVLRAGFGFVYPPRDVWRQDKKLAGGGPLLDLGPHVIDTLRWLAGEVVAVTARIANARFDYTVEDLAGAILEFESGALATMDVGYSYNDASLAVVGSEGSAFVHRAFGQLVDWELTVRIGSETTVQSGRSERSYVDEIEDFSDAIEKGRPAPIPGEEGLRQMEVIEAIYESAATGERVELEE